MTSPAWARRPFRGPKQAAIPASPVILHFQINPFRVSGMNLAHRSFQHKLPHGLRTVPLAKISLKD